MSDQGPTIRDVARAAGVSAMSVSRVLNGQPGVGEATAQRIRELMKTMGYRPNTLATTLRQRRQLSLIGMIVPDPHPAVFTSIAVEVNQLLHDDGFIVVTASSSSDVEQERSLVRSFVERGFDGILLFSDDTDHGYLAANLPRSRPTVFLGTPPRGIEAPAVVADHRAGAHLAISHLADHGHRRIGIIASTTFFPAAERLAGYREAVAELGLDDDPDLIQLDSITTEHGHDAASALLRLPSPPTAIFSTTYLLTAGSMGVIRSHPTDIALVAFDDFEAAAMLDLPITVITQDTEAMARHAARLLRAQMAGGGSALDGEAERVVVPVHLIPRGSGEVRPPPVSATSR